jgi:cytochrome c biogenesis protein CcmG/thiol:disulfide interchange protein DsbE
MKNHSLRKGPFVPHAKTHMALLLQTLILLLFAVGYETRSYSGTNDQIAGGSTNLPGSVGNAAATQAPATNGQAAAEKIPAAMKLVGKPVPKVFRLPLLTGGEIELPPATNHGLLLLDFCAYWCKPSRETMPVLAEIAKDYSARGVRNVAVNQGEASEKIRRYLASAKLELCVALDKKCGMAAAFGVKGIPTIVIVDRSNIIRYVQEGAGPELGAELRRVLDEVLKAESGQSQSSPQKNGNGSAGSANERN